jgi:hypothetical protein
MNADELVLYLAGLAREETAHCETTILDGRDVLALEAIEAGRVEKEGERVITAYLHGVNCRAGRVQADRSASPAQRFLIAPDSAIAHKAREVDHAGHPAFQGSTGHPVDLRQDGVEGLSSFRVRFWIVEFRGASWTGDVQQTAQCVVS